VDDRTAIIHEETATCGHGTTSN